MASIKHYLIIKATPQKVYDAITLQEGLAGWWTEETVATPKMGAIIEFKFGDRYHNKMEVTALEPTHRVTWRCLVGDEEWIGTRFVFELAEKKDQTVLRFTHSDWKSETDFFANCNYHWGYYLRSLKQYCETGIGTPFTPDEAT